MPTTRTRSTTRKPRTTRTKVDVETEFESIQAEAQDAEVMDPQAATLAHEHSSKIRTAVKDLSVDTIVQNGATLGLEIGRTLSRLTEQCVAKANELKTLQEAVEIESKELDRLYNLDVASASIQLLIQEHEQKKAEFSKQIQDIREQWVEEQALHQKVVSERNTAQEQVRRREQEDYEYKKFTERTRTEEAFTLKMQRQEREQQEKLQVVEKDITERKAAIAKEELEISAMKTRIENIDTEIKAKADRDVAIAANALKKDLENKHLIEKKDLETQLQLERQKNASINEANGKLAQQIELLTKQLDAARDQVQNIAIKSLESASGQTALSKVLEVTKENGATTRGGKS